MSWEQPGLTNLTVIEWFCPYGAQSPVLCALVSILKWNHASWCPPLLTCVRCCCVFFSGLLRALTAALCLPRLKVTGNKRVRKARAVGLTRKQPFSAPQTLSLSPAVRRYLPWGPPTLARTWVFSEPRNWDYRSLLVCLCFFKVAVLLVRELWGRRTKKTKQSSESQHQCSHPFVSLCRNWSLWFLFFINKMEILLCSLT